MNESTLTLRQQFSEDRKTMLTAGYRQTVRNMFDDYGNDIDGISKLMFAVINEDYDPQDCKDSKELQKAYRTLCKTCQEIGSETTYYDVFGGVVVFVFGKPSDGVRALTVSVKSQKEVDLLADRKEEDKKRNADRKEENDKLAEETRLETLDNMSDLEVFMQVADHIRKSYPNREVRWVLAAGLTWFDQQDELAESEEDDTPATGTNG